MKNDYVGGEFQKIEGVTFVYKGWVSGQKELYVNIPTTNTYYKPHLGGLVHCKNNRDEITMENTGLSSAPDINNESTDIRVTIKRSGFDNVRNFSDIVIDGQSLPLKLYRDDAYDCGGACDCFHSVVKESVFLGKEHSPDSITLYFRCFGTDEQALKLIGF